MLKTPKDEIQTKIDIILASIDMYGAEIDDLLGVDNDLRAQKILRLKEEQQKLEEYKTQYPEYFI